MSQEPMGPIEIPKLDAADATKMLDSIFEESGMEPNTIPMEALTAYSEGRRERHILRKIVIGLAIAVVLLLPLLYITPKYEVVLAEESRPGLPVYAVEVRSFLPVSRVNASMQGASLIVKPDGERLYKIVPPWNGEMTVTVTLSNHQETSQTVTIREVDDTEPEALSAGTDGEWIRLIINDDLSGIDYEGTYALRDDGETVRPSSYDEKTGEIVLRYTDAPCDLYVPDLAGNTLHLRLSYE